MKKLLLAAVAVAFSGITTFAQTLADGFYRVQNKGSQKYLYVRDCTGDASIGGTDLGAIETWSNLSNAISDPGSIIYVNSVNGKYTLSAQGVSVNEVIGTNMSIDYTDGFWQIYSSGQYLYDLGVGDNGSGMLGAKTSAEAKVSVQHRHWYAKLISSGTTNYFGFKPTVTAGNKHYAPFFADFAYTPNAAVKTWYVSQIDKANGIAVVKQITGTVAKRQAVFVECIGTESSSNKVDLTITSGNKATSNKLTGVYFDNGDRIGISHTGKSPACVFFDPSTMRVLGTDSNGKLAFVNSNVNLKTIEVRINKETVNKVVIPHNQSYLAVDADCPATLTVMTEAEYNFFLADVNRDNKVNIGDVTKVLENIKSGTYSSTVDANQDGKINIGDVTRILEIIKTK